MSSPAPLLTVKLAVKSVDILKTLIKIVLNMEGLELLQDKDATNADILVLEIGSDPDKEFETIRLLVQENVVGTLFLTSDKMTPEILLPALRAGAKEFFPQPLDQAEVEAAFRNLLDQKKKKSGPENETKIPGKIISVLGAKGGVGTTTFAVNLATSIQAKDSSKLVALIDMNRLTGEVPLFLDLEANTNWEEIGKNLSRLDKAYLQSAMAKHSSGVYVLPAPSKRDTEVHLPSGFLYQLLSNMRHFFDYIIVDHGMYFDDSSFRIFQESEAVYIVSILSLPCVINVRKLQESIRESTRNLENGRLRVIANRFEKKSQIALTEANKIIGSDIHMTIPNNYGLTMSAINNGKPIAEIGKSSDVAKAYKKLADSLFERSLEKSGGIFGWFNKSH